MVMSFVPPGWAVAGGSSGDESGVPQHIDILRDLAQVTWAGESDIYEDFFPPEISSSSHHWGDSGLWVLSVYRLGTSSVAIRKQTPTFWLCLVQPQDCYKAALSRGVFLWATQTGSWSSGWARQRQREQKIIVIVAIVIFFITLRVF